MLDTDGVDPIVGTDGIDELAEADASQARDVLHLAVAGPVGAAFGTETIERHRISKIARVRNLRGRVFARESAFGLGRS